MPRIRVFTADQKLTDRPTQLISKQLAAKWVDWRWGKLTGDCFQHYSPAEKAEAIAEWIAGRDKRQSLEGPMPPLELSRFPTKGPHADYHLAHFGTQFGSGEQKEALAGLAELGL